MLFDFNDCIKENLLRKIPPSKDKAIQSIKKANRWLKEAGSSLKASAFNSSVLASYMAMFHAARSILFIDGYREKSHACVARYLEEKYVKTGKIEKKWIELFDHYREIRHTDQYSVSFSATEEEAKKAIKSAAEFLERMKRFLKGHS